MKRTLTLLAVVLAALALGFHWPTRAAQRSPSVNADGGIEGDTNTALIEGRPNWAPAGTSSCLTIAASDVRSLPDSSVLRAAEMRNRATSTRRGPHEVCVGMHRDQVQAAWGLPMTMMVQRQGLKRYAEWTYASHTVFIEDTSVVAIR